MPVADKILALLDTMTPASLDDLPPAHRRRFADVCRYWADRADKPKTGVTLPRPRKSEGVLASLARGDRSH